MYCLSDVYNLLALQSLVKLIAAESLENRVCLTTLCIGMYKKRGKTEVVVHFGNNYACNVCGMQMYHWSTSMNTEEDHDEKEEGGGGRLFNTNGLFWA